MSEDIVEYNMNSVMDGVKKKIKATFVELIPDGEWEGLIKKEVDKFFKEEDRYGRKEESEFTKIVKQVISKIIKKKLEDLIEKRYKNTVWENGGPKASKAIEKMIMDNSNKIMLNMIGSMVQESINNMQPGY